MRATKISACPSGATYTGPRGAMPTTADFADRRWRQSGPWSSIGPIRKGRICLADATAYGWSTRRPGVERSVSAGLVTNTGGTDFHATAVQSRSRSVPTTWRARALLRRTPHRCTPPPAPSRRALAFTPCSIVGQNSFWHCTFTLTGNAIAGGVVTGAEDVTCDVRLEASPANSLCHITDSTPVSYTNPTGIPGSYPARLDLAACGQRHGELPARHGRRQAAPRARTGRASHPDAERAARLWRQTDARCFQNASNGRRERQEHRIQNDETPALRGVS